MKKLFALALLLGVFAVGCAKQEGGSAPAPEASPAPPAADAAPAGDAAPPAN